MEAMKRGMGLDVIDVRKKELLSKLRENRNKHIEEYQTALKGFRDASVKQLEELLEDAYKCRNTNGVDGEIPTVVHFDHPKSHEEEYDSVIEMLEMSVAEEVSITRDQFKCYVQDKWSWKQNFMMTNMKYTDRG